MSADNEKLVRDFCAAWSRSDVDELLSYFTDDAVYHNIPMEPLRGKAAIRQFLETFTPQSTDVAFEILALVSSGPVVFTERVDRFSMGGKRIALPVAGVFEVRGGKIAGWRDYFDMQTWLKQTGAA
jgi:limonene-1,2-epoxide hydrolase